MADYPLKQEAAEVQDILDGAFLSNKGQVFTEETKAFMREKIGASATGDGIKILSHFDTLEELQTAVPNPNAGDAFSVGANLPYNLYIFDFYNGDWRNYGPIRANDIKARFAQNIPVSVSAWEEDTTVFADYTFKARIALAEVTGNDFPIVAFAPSDAISGNFCPIAYCFDGYIEIWAKSIPTAGITLPAATFIIQDTSDTVTGNSTKGITNASGGVATGGIGTEQIADGAITRTKLSKSAVSRVFEAAIGTNWTGSAAPYTQEIAVEGLPDSNRIFAGLDFSDDWETAVKEDEEFNKIVKITATNGNMKVYAEEPTTVQLNVKLTVFTGQGTGGDDDGEGGGSGGGVQADWNQTDETAPDFIKNKPFGEVKGGSDTLLLPFYSQDELLQKIESGELVFIEAASLVKVSDALPTMSDLSNGLIASVAGETSEIPLEMIEEINGMISILGNIMVIPESMVGVEFEGVIPPEAGVYFLADLLLTPDVYIVIPGYTGFDTIKKIDAKYIPNNRVEFYADMSSGGLFKDAEFTQPVFKMDVVLASHREFVIKMIINGQDCGIIHPITVYYQNPDYASIDVCMEGEIGTFHTTEYTP